MKNQIDLDLLSIIVKCLYENNCIIYNIGSSISDFGENGSYCFEYYDHDFNIKNFNRTFAIKENKPSFPWSCGMNSFYGKIIRCENGETKNYYSGGQNNFFNFENHIVQCDKRILFVHEYFSN